MVSVYPILLLDCGMAVEKPQIWRVDQPCDRSQLPDMTYGTFSQGHLSTTVSGQMGVVGEWIKHTLAISSNHWISISSLLICGQVNDAAARLVT